MTVQSIFPNGAPLPLLLGVAAVFAYFLRLLQRGGHRLQVYPAE